MGCDIHGVLQRRFYLSPGWKTVCSVPQVRDYGTFAILAGVRNCWDELEPISDPKGKIKDFPKMSYSIDYHCVDAHSHTWLTLEEIEEYDFDKKISVLITVDENGKEVKNFNKKINDFISVKNRSGMKKLLNSTHEELRKKPVRILLNDTWKCFFEFMRLLAFKKNLKENELRIVIWFDN